MGYQISVFKELVKIYSAEIHVFHWDKKKQTPFNPPILNQIYYYKRSEFSTKHIKKIAQNIKPDIVYISGWMDRGYLLTVMQLRKQNIPIVCGFDGIWKKKIRQRIASSFFPFVKKIFFNYAWVSGPYQYEYAKKLGFKNNEIIHNCYSADIELFNLGYDQSMPTKKNAFPHCFLFVGRFEKIKGIDILIQAWSEIKKQNKNKDWELHLIGNGSMYNELSKNKYIEIKGFKSYEELSGLVKNYGCFILPSYDEPWGLVIHEFSALGLPIICSDVCGAAPIFVIPDFNGFIFKSKKINDLKNKMIRIINTSDDKLITMSENSHEIGQRITPKLSAASLMSVLQ